MSEHEAPRSSGGGLFGIDLGGIAELTAGLFAIDFLSDRGLVGSTAPERTLDQSAQAQPIQGPRPDGLTGTEIALMIGGGILVLGLVLLIMKD